MLYSIIFLLISYINIQISSQTLYFAGITGGQEVTRSMHVHLALLITGDIYQKPLQKVSDSLSQFTVKDSYYLF